MAKTIPQLTDATTVNAADELIIQQGGITKRATGAELAKGLNAINGTVNVKDFGAVGDGVADDTAAIQAAIDSATASSGACSVFLPAGNYRITASVILKSDLSIHGAGWRKSVILGNISDSLIRASSTAYSLTTANRRFYINIEDLGFNNTSNTNAGSNGIDFRQVTHGTIQRCFISNCETGINLSNFTTEISVRDVDINSVITGISMVNGPRHILIDRVRVNTTTTGYIVDEGTDDGANQITFLSCECANSTTAFSIGVAATIATIVASVTMIGCRCENSSSSGTGIAIGQNGGANFWEAATRFQNIATPFTWGGTAADQQDPVSFRTGRLFPVLVREGINSVNYGRITYNHGASLISMRGAIDSAFINLAANNITANGNLTIADTKNIVLATGTGTKIGTAVSQKLGFFNAAPVVQPAAAAQAAVAAQTQDSVTDSTGGSATTTLGAITAPAANATTSLTDDMTAVKNALASIAAQLAKIKTDVANIKTFQDAERTAVVNLGLIKGAA
jgi:hypothetical protein